MPEKLIAIKGFQIPETCISCPMQFGGWCGVAPSEVDERVAETVDEAWRQKRPEWCPLVEVEVPQMRAETERGTLKPCPFCGSETAPEIFTLAEIACHDDDEATEFERSHFAVACNYSRGGCGASTGGICETEEEAAEAWNRRADNGE